MLVKTFYIGKYFWENQLRPKEFSPKPKEKKVIIKQKSNTEKKLLVYQGNRLNNIWWD